MPLPTVLRSLNDCCWRLRNAVSLISTEATPWAERNRTPSSNIARAAILFARINCTRWLIGWVGHGTGICDDSAHIRGAQRISVGWHERGAIERWSAMENNRRQIGVAHLVQR